MALMKLNKLPTSKELTYSCVEAEPFLDAFNENAVAPFVAKGKINADGAFVLGRWIVGPGEWFTIVTDE